MSMCYGTLGTAVLKAKNEINNILHLGPEPAQEPSIFLGQWPSEPSPSRDQVGTKSHAHVHKLWGAAAPQTPPLFWGSPAPQIIRLGACRPRAPRERVKPGVRCRTWPLSDQSLAQPPSHRTHRLLRK